MPAQVVSFLQRRVRPQTRDWSQDELAEFYRVEAALLQSGMRIETDRGLTDEGDPWFAFCRADDGETFIHFARIDGRYIIAGPAYEGVAQGYDFPELVRDLISRHPLVQPTLQRRNNTNIFMHPAALLIAVVGTAFFKTDAAKAAESPSSDEGVPKGEKRHVGGASPATVPAPSLPSIAGAQPAGQVALDAVHTLSLVASAMAAMSPTPVLGGTASPFATVPPLADDLSALPAAAQAKSLTPEHGELPSFAFDPSGPPPAAHTALDNPAQVAAFGALLSLTAVLQDLPKPQPIQAAGAIASVLALLPAEAPRPAGQIEAAQLALSAAPAKVAASASATAPPANPILVIDLSSAALPDVAAVRLVRDLGAGMSQDAVLKLDQLPRILAQLIAKGEHLETPAFSLTAPSFEIPRDLTVAAPEHGAGAAQPDAALPIAIDPAAGAVVVPPTPVLEKTTIDAIVADFVARTGQVEVAINGHDIVMYDVRIMTDTVVQGMSNSVTFAFADGSSIHLIGLAQTLHDVGALH